MSVKRLSICVDLDGVLAKYDGWKGVGVIGNPIPGAADFTKELGKLAHIIIFTTRCKQYPVGKDHPIEVTGDTGDVTVSQLQHQVQQWLHRYGFHYDEIYIGQGKPIASAYIDDRALTCRPQDNAPGNPTFAFSETYFAAKRLLGV